MNLIRVLNDTNMAASQKCEVEAVLSLFSEIWCQFVEISSHLWYNRVYDKSLPNSNGCNFLILRLILIKQILIETALHGV
jgi:hypothetical protein